MNIDKLCKNCFHEIKKNDKKICEVCHFDNNKKNNHPFLNIGYKIDNKYIIGKAIEQNVQELIYKAINIETKEVVIIKEFFPNTIVERKQDTNGLHIKKEFYGIAYNDIINNYVYFYENLRNLKLNEVEQVYDIINFENHQFIIIKNYLENGNTYNTINDYVKNSEKNKLPLNEAIDIIKKISNTSKILHENSIFDQNINSKSVMIDNKKNIILKNLFVSKNPLIINFFDSEENCFVSGKELYTPQSDIYSISILFAFILTGKKPVKITKDYNIINAFDFDDTIPSNIINLIDKAVNYNYKYKFNNIEEFLSSLNAASLKMKNLSKNIEDNIYKNIDTNVLLTKKEKNKLLKIIKKSQKNIINKEDIKNLKEVKKQKKKNKSVKIKNETDPLTESLNNNEEYNNKIYLKTLVITITITFLCLLLITYFLFSTPSQGPSKYNKLSSSNFFNKITNMVGLI